MKVLHLSDTPLSGSPIRISNLLNRIGNSGEAAYKTNSIHLVWHPTWGFRDFGADVVSSKLDRAQIATYLEWADVIHYHNRYERQLIFTQTGLKPPKKPSVIQMHSPRKSEDFSGEVKSGVPIAVIAQYHVREWSELKFIVPNVVDIDLPEYKKFYLVNTLPIVSYAPSNCNLKGWDDKGYNIVAPVLKRMALASQIQFQLIVNQPHSQCLELKRFADIGIDEVVTGSYHLSSLEYLAMGTPCFANIDELTRKAIVEVTGAEKLPWEVCKPHEFESKMRSMVMFKSYVEEGKRARRWMDNYWNPEFLYLKYVDMYRSL